VRRRASKEASGPEVRGKAGGWASERERRWARGTVSEKESGQAQIRNVDEHYMHGDRECAGQMPSTQVRPTNGSEREMGDCDGGQTRGAHNMPIATRSAQGNCQSPLHADEVVNGDLVLVVETYCIYVQT